MMATEYTPTLEDMAYLMKSKPDKFRNARASRESIERVMNMPDSAVRVGPEKQLIIGTYQDYLKHGGEPLTRSPIPPESGDADNDGVMDPEFAAICTTCKTGEACCLLAYEVSDAVDSKRKISWPIKKGSPDTLYVTTKDPHAGSPSKKIKTTITKKKDCQVGRPNSPALKHINFADGPDETSGSAELTATNNFAIPAAMSALFPEEVLSAFYVCGMYMSYSAYKTNDLPVVQQSQCMSFSMNSPGVTVHPVPHCSLKGEVEGSANITFYFSKILQLPTMMADFSGKLTGEVGNQTINFKAGVKRGTDPNPPQKQGPVKNPLLANINDIYTSLHNTIGSVDTNERLPVGGTPRENGSTVTVSLKTNVKVDGFNLKEKSDSPNLTLEAGTGSFGINLGVTGKADLVGLLINKVPYLKETRESLDDEDNVISTKIVCDLKLEADGGFEFGWSSPDGIEIGGQDGWEANLKGLNNTYTGEAKIQGALIVEANVGANTWFFEGSAGIEGSVSTAWHYGGRISEHANGTQKTETLKYFEGLRVRGTYYVKSGNKKSKKGQESGVYSSSGAETTLHTGSFDRSFWPSDPGTAESNWKEV